MGHSHRLTFMTPEASMACMCAWLFAYYFSRVLANMGNSPKLVTRAEAISQHGCALEFASEVPAILLWKVSSMLWYSFIILGARLQHQRCYLGMLTHTGRRFGKIVKSFGRQFTASRNFSGVLSSTPCASVSKCSEFLDLGMMSVHGTCNFKPPCPTGDVQFSHTILAIVLSIDVLTREAVNRTPRSLTMALGGLPRPGGHGCLGFSRLCSPQPAVHHFILGVHVGCSLFSKPKFRRDFLRGRFGAQKLCSPGIVDIGTMQSIE